MTKPARKAKGNASDGQQPDAPHAVGALPEPTDRRKDAIAFATDRMTKRRQRVTLAMPNGGNSRNLAVQSPHADQNGWAAQLNDAFGTTSTDFANKMLTTLANLSQARGGNGVNELELNAALAFVDGIEPQNEVEASLAVSMYGATDLANDLLRRAKHADRIDFLTQYVNAATKLQRTAVAQAEALAKLRRGGEQVVKVVYVDQRTQTVIGEQHNHGGRSSDQYARADGAALPLAATVPIDLTAAPAATGERIK